MIGDEAWAKMTHSKMCTIGENIWEEASAAREMARARAGCSCPHDLLHTSRWHESTRLLCLPAPFIES